MRTIIGVIFFIAALAVITLWSNSGLEAMAVGQRNWDGPWYLLALIICVIIAFWALFGPRKNKA